MLRSKRTFAAIIAALTAFAASGGIHATETAIKAKQGLAEAGARPGATDISPAGNR